MSEVRGGRFHVPLNFAYPMGDFQCSIKVEWNNNNKGGIEIVKVDTVGEEPPRIYDTGIYDSRFQFVAMPGVDQYHRYSIMWFLFQLF